MKNILIILLLFITTASFSQAGSELNYLSSLDQKKQATYDDAVQMFAYQLGMGSSSFTVTREQLKQRGITGVIYSASTPLNKGMIAFMTSKYLKLNYSLLFMITDAERYALRNCISSKIMDSDSSENDSVSGIELIEIFSRIGETMEGAK